MEHALTKTELEKYFERYRNNIVGIDATFESPYGIKLVIYADWIASGRLYKPIEEKLCHTFGPMVGNTHSEASETGTLMTRAYQYAQKIIKDHVNAGKDDVIITAATGMTGVICKLQRILGLKVPEKLEKYIILPEEDRPVIFVTHLEHHSNHTSWLETIADVIVLEPDNNLLVVPENLEIEIRKYAERKIKIGAFSACSNVTGYRPPIYQLAKIMHQHNGVCLVDYAASAPYDKIDMHPGDPMEDLDGIYFSPHKFLGGPGSSGVVIFNKKLYHNRIPDHPGGGTVNWTNRWNEYSYVTDVEAREDGGTPGFIQAFRIALSIQLKEQMGYENIRKREEELLQIALSELPKIERLKILASNVEDRLGVISFYIEGTHHNLVAKLLNDLYGIQVRGGCSCAGTYGHFLLNVDHDHSREITEKIETGDLSLKPGWIRLSLHPTMSNEELHTIINALNEIVVNMEELKTDYKYSSSSNEFHHVNNDEDKMNNKLKDWFQL
ncbi:aminotransferase class V-fold PLP-dependent enzyme [Bacteroidota bacterium]